MKKFKKNNKFQFFLPFSLHNPNFMLHGDKITLIYIYIHKNIIKKKNGTFEEKFVKIVEIRLVGSLARPVNWIKLIESDLHLQSTQGPIGGGTGVTSHLIQNLRDINKL